MLPPREVFCLGKLYQWAWKSYSFDHSREPFHIRKPYLRAM